MPSRKTSGDSVVSQSLTVKKLAKQCETLGRKDALLGAIVRELGVPPLWNRTPGFATLVHIILEQQVSLRSAFAINERIKKSCKGSVSTRKIELLGEAGLRELGVTRQKSHYICLLAQAASSRKLLLTKLGDKSPEDARSALMAQKGIGVWTSEVYILMALCYQDAFPVGDLALIRELNTQLDAEMNWDEITEYAERWRPYRAVAARILWLSYLARQGK